MIMLIIFINTPFILFLLRLAHESQLFIVTIPTALNLVLFFPLTKQMHRISGLTFFLNEIIIV